MVCDDADVFVVAFVYYMFERLIDSASASLLAPQRNSKVKITYCHSSCTPDPHGAGAKP
jgi:hypothetical protein